MSQGICGAVWVSTLPSQIVSLWWTREVPTSWATERAHSCSTDIPHCENKHKGGQRGNVLYMKDRQCPRSKVTKPTIITSTDNPRRGYLIGAIRLPYQSDNLQKNALIGPITRSYLSDKIPIR